MKFLVSLITLLTISGVSLGNAVLPEKALENQIIFKPKATLRNADPCNRWEDWQVGDDATKVPHLRDGHASHHLYPAEIILYSSIDNGLGEYKVNPLLLITYMDVAGKIVRSRPHEKNFDEKLLTAAGYYPDDSYYHGFYPNIISLAFQIALDQKRGLSLEAFHEKHYGSVVSFEDFQKAYQRFASILNRITKTPFPLSPDFTSFTKLGFRDIQMLFVLIRSPLREDLFQKHSLSPIYRNPSLFCN